MVKNLTHQQVIDHLHYDPCTGIFIRKIATARMMKVGDIAGTDFLKGRYRSICLLGRPYLAHRLAWMYVYGEWPKYNVDHIDGNGCNNKIENLRCVPQVKNSRNQKKRITNTSGHMGIDWIEKCKAWRVRIGVGNKTKHIGHFSDLSEALISRKMAEEKYGYHENHGRD